MSESINTDLSDVFNDTYWSPSSDSQRSRAEASDGAPIKASRATPRVRLTLSESSEFKIRDMVFAVSLTFVPEDFSVL